MRVCPSRAERVRERKLKLIYPTLRIKFKLRLALCSSLIQTDKTSTGCRAGREQGGRGEGSDGPDNPVNQMVTPFCLVNSVLCSIVIPSCQVILVAALTVSGVAFFLRESTG